MNVILHFPSGPEALKDLEKRYARTKAGFILDQMERYAISAEEKLEILDQILSQNRGGPIS